MMVLLKYYIVGLVVIHGKPTGKLTSNSPCQTQQRANKKWNHQWLKVNKNEFNLNFDV